MGFVALLGCAEGPVAIDPGGSQSAAPEAVTVSLRRGDIPREGLVVVFTEPDGALGPVARTDRNGFAGAFIVPGSALHVLYDPDILSIYDVQPGDHFVLHRPPEVAAGSWTEVALAEPWAGATRHKASLGCGPTAVFVDGMASVFTPASCPVADEPTVLGLASGEDGGLLASTFGSELAVGDWSTDTVGVQLDVPGIWSTPHVGQLSLGVLHDGRWFETVNLDVQFDQGFARTMAAAPAGFASGLQRRVIIATSNDRVDHFVRSAPSATPDPIPLESLASAVDVRIDRGRWALDIHTRDVPGALAVHVVLRIVTNEHDEPPGRWDLVLPPDWATLPLPALPTEIATVPDRRFSNGEAYLVAGTPSRSLYWSRYAGFYAGQGPDPRLVDEDPQLELTAWRDPDLKR